LTHDEEMETLRYPVGRFSPKRNSTDEDRDVWIGQIERLPAELGSAIAGLDADQLDTPYRPGGWTVRQVVHHLADSHVNSHVRFRLAVTEREPVIRPYQEAAWAELPDARDGDPAMSLELLSGLHRRWVAFLRSLDADAWRRAFQHPESGRITLDTSLQLYAWHGRHHVAHVRKLRERMRW
jgi:uncharacterized damage-inducible protein DinB